MSTSTNSNLFSNTRMPPLSGTRSGGYGAYDVSFLLVSRTIGTENDSRFSSNGWTQAEYSDFVNKVEIPGVDGVHVQRFTWAPLRALEMLMVMALTVLRGYRVVYTPHAVLRHHEYATRGADRTPAQQARAAAETSLMRQRWRSVIAEDPHYPADFAAAWLFCGGALDAR